MIELNASQMQAFYDVQWELANACHWYAPHPTAPFKVVTDASNYAIGAAIEQNVDDNWQPVAFYSRKLSPAETRYPVHERELLAIVASLKAYGWLLQGRKFFVWTDHAPLIHILSQPNLSDRQTRWLEWLCRFDFEVRYIPGPYNVVADYLSRHPQLYRKIRVALRDAFRLLCRAAPYDKCRRVESR